MLTSRLRSRDLRFEQSYLHSIQEAKSWWMVAWITSRDQVWFALRDYPVHRRRLTLLSAKDHDAHATRSCLQSRLVWLATLEQKCSAERELGRGKSAEMVVQRQ